MLGIILFAKTHMRIHMERDRIIAWKPLAMSMVDITYGQGFYEILHAGTTPDSISLHVIYTYVSFL
jgi:hypothetical protein